ncbi:sodium-dependent transporter [Salinisphaera sp. USBA-960]|uniref:sodium-dependent transporter n=1 Tax=Salinisphaera orenii TaxID=856731 RepID=UPI000DBEA7A0|nr:sodium-dependent transporter [Salifodinibacter halophilus]NNC25510.1 sodium-dependent transporter [Salifodinibacter halophilus]
MTLALDRPRRWSSYTTFVVVVVAALVNLSGFWRLPYLIEANGGAAFVMVYLGAALLVGVPLVAGQLLLVRGTNLDIFGTVATVTRRSRVAGLWRALAAVMLVALVLLLAVYAVVSAWSIAFAVRGLAGVLPTETATAATTYFHAFLRDSARGWGWLVLLATVVMAVAGAGLHRGLSVVMRMLAGLLVLGLAVVLIATYVWGGSGSALASWLTFGPAALGWPAVIAAFGQTVFGLALGSGVLLGLGTYLPARAPVVRLAWAVVAGQVVVSLLAAAAVVAIIHPEGATRLDALQQLFVVIPAHGGAFGLAELLLAVLAVAAITTMLALFEPLVLFIERRLEWSRIRASVSAAGVILLVAGFALLSYGPLTAWPGVGRDVFGGLIWLVGGVLLPVGALWLAAVSIAAVEKRLAVAHRDGDTVGGLKLWLGLLRLPALLALMVVAVESSGLLAWARALWAE